jgi:GNAT superfamily N-acetyltransferase
MGIEIRPLTFGDYEDIFRVWTAAGLPFKPNGRDSREMVAVEMGHDYCTFLGAFSDGRLIGAGIVQFDSRRGWINRMAVDPQYQGKGVAGRLVAACVEWLKQFDSSPAVSALIEEKNQASAACFTKAGFHYHPSITYWAKRPRRDL